MTTTLERVVTSPWGAVMYRVCDKAGGLIYVGSTSDFDRRLRQHAYNSWWAALADRIDLEFYPNMIQAHGAEVHAIREESPAFNIMSLGVTPPRMLALTSEEQRVLNEWAAANPTRLHCLPLAFRWALDAEIRGAA